MHRKDWRRQVTQVVWEDLRPWIEQLAAQHGVMCTFKVYLMADQHKLKPVVALEAFRPGGGKVEDVAAGRWEVFDATVCGGAASCGLRLVTRLLLDLDDRKAAREAHDPMF